MKLLSIGMTAMVLFLSPAIKSQTNSADGFPFKQGATLNYDVNANGQMLQIALVISDLKDGGLVWTYSLPDGSSGKLINSSTNLDKGSLLNWDEISPGEERILPDDQTIAMVSRPFLKELKSAKKAKYDGIDFILKKVPAGSEIKVNGKALPVVYAETEQGTSKIWVLDHPAYPIILKFEGNPMGIDIAVSAVN